MTSPAQPDRLTVSVALCTRNGARFVADDDSSDGTVAIRSEERRVGKEW